MHFVPQQVDGVVSSISILCLDSLSAFAWTHPLKNSVLCVCVCVCVWGGGGVMSRRRRCQESDGWLVEWGFYAMW